MSALEPIVELEDVGLCYRLGKQRVPSLKELTIHWIRGALRYEQLWALENVSLTISRGESVGVIGRNGAGKSTLLKVISRVLKPSRGRARVEGLVAPILELGTGFDHELTGVENVYLNSLLLGHTRRQTQERVESIVEFSGLGDFIHSPIRNYSSGMVARLGFSIATAWKPDLLILDEVLAVGDAHFTHRCEERMTELNDRGTTLLLVSHSAASILRRCQRCIWLEKGRVRADGEAGEVLDLYNEDAAADQPAAAE